MIHSNGKTNGALTYDGVIYGGFWDTIKRLWKDGRHPKDHTLISGVSYAGFRKTYEVGEGFVMYPDLPWQRPGHVCELWKKDTSEELQTGRNGANTCSYLS